MNNISKSIEIKNSFYKNLPVAISVRSFIIYGFIEMLIYLCYNLYSNTSDGYTDNVNKY